MDILDLLLYNSWRVVKSLGEKQKLHGKHNILHTTPRCHSLIIIKTTLISNYNNYYLFPI